MQGAFCERRGVPDVLWGSRDFVTVMIASLYAHGCVCVCVHGQMDICRPVDSCTRASSLWCLCTCGEPSCCGIVADTSRGSCPSVPFVPSVGAPPPPSPTRSLYPPVHASWPRREGLPPRRNWRGDRLRCTHRCLCASYPRRASGEEAPDEAEATKAGDRVQMAPRSACVT